MKTSVRTNEHCYNSTSAWDNMSVYGHHGYHQQYHHQQISYDDNRQYGVTTGRQYVVVPSTSYPTPAADTHGLAPCFDDSAQHLRQPSTADMACQPDNMAVTGSYASTRTGSAYSDGCADARQRQQLPDVVGGHLEGWMNHGVCALQDSSQHQTGRLQLVHIRSNAHVALKDHSLINSLSCG